MADNIEKKEDIRVAEPKEKVRVDVEVDTSIRG